MAHSLAAGDRRQKRQMDWQKEMLDSTTACLPNSSSTTPAAASKSSFSKIYSIARNFTPSILSNVWSSTPILERRPDNSHPSLAKIPVSNTMDDYLSNDEDEYVVSSDAPQSSTASHHVEIVKQTSFQHFSTEHTNKRLAQTDTDLGLNAVASKRLKLSAPEETASSKKRLLPSRPKNARRFWTSRVIPSQCIMPSEDSTAGNSSVSRLGSRLDVGVSQPVTHNLFSVPSRLSMTSRIKPAITGDMLLGVNSETRRILLDLERACGTPVADAKRMRVWNKSLGGGVSTLSNDSTSSHTGAPPSLSTLRTTDKVQVVPRLVTLGSNQIIQPSDEVSRHPLEAGTKSTDVTHKNVSALTTISAYPANEQRPYVPVFQFSQPVVINDRNLKVGPSREANTQPTFHMTNKHQPAPKDIALSTKETDRNEQQKQPSVSSALKASDSKQTEKSGETQRKFGSVQVSLEEYKRATKWRCGGCHFNNHPDDDACCQCLRPKSTGQPYLVNGQREHKADERVAKWTCKKCKLENEAKAEKCVCCQTSKNFDPATASAACTSASSKWSCPSCWISNEATASSCVACNEPKPTVKSTTVSSADWTCDQCFIKNVASVNKCLSCGGGRTKQPIVEQQATITKKEPSKQSWSCTTCFVTNAADKVKCDSCQSPKPGTSFKSVSFGLGLPTSTAVNGGFTMPQPTSTSAKSSAPLSFGVPQSESASTISKLPVVNTGTIAGVSATAASPLFAFGITTTAATTTAPLSSVMSAIPSSALSTTTVSTKADTATIPKFSVPAPVTTISANAPDTRAISSTTTTDLFAFGAKNLGNALSKSSTSPSFAFGAPTTTINSTLESNVPFKTTTVAPQMPFGFSKPVSSNGVGTEGKTAPSTSFAFSATSTTAASGDKGLFSFGKSAANNGPVSNTVAPFGLDKVPPSTTTFPFGNASSGGGESNLSSVKSAPAIAPFGLQPQTQPFAAPDAAGTAKSAVAPFSFSDALGKQATTTISQPLFNFTATSSSASNAPTFAFGKSMAQSASTNLFDGLSNGGRTADENKAKLAETSTATGSSAGIAWPLTNGSEKTSTFMFGQRTAAGENSAAPSTAATAPSGGFNFNFGNVPAAASTTSSSSGLPASFNFSASSGVAPTYQFTASASNNNMFSATPSGRRQLIAKRKQKRT